VAADGTLLWRHGGDLNAWMKAGKKHLMVDVLPTMKLVDREIECAEGVVGPPLAALGIAQRARGTRNP
jgi:hypothetical protein